jgi:hypothetical protein
MTEDDGVPVLLTVARTRRGHAFKTPELHVLDGVTSDGGDP